MTSSKTIDFCLTPIVLHAYKTMHVSYDRFCMKTRGQDSKLYSPPKYSFQKKYRRGSLTTNGMLKG